MWHFLQILSGVGLLLFAIRFLKNGVTSLMGSRSNDLAQGVVSRPLRAIATGVAIGVAVPSSASVAALVMQAVTASQLTALRALPLAIGTDIGSTALVLFTSLHVRDAIPLLIIVGVGLYQFARRSRSRAIGQILLSLALVLMASGIFSTVGQEVAGNKDLATLIGVARDYPFILIILAGVTALLLQSATATILLIAGFGSTGALDLPLALLVTVGANMGTAAIRLGIGWPHEQTRRLAAILLVGRGTIAIAVGLWYPVIASWFELLPLGYSMRVAMTHLGFNLAVALLCLVAKYPLTLLAGWVIPSPSAKEAEPFGPRYLGREARESPALALGQSQREILRAAEIVRQMLKDLWHAIETGDEELAHAVSQRDDEVDLLDLEIKRFLSEVAGHDIDDETSAEQLRQLRYLSEIEAIGDIVDKNLSELALKKISHKAHIDAPTWTALSDFCTRVQENMLIAENVFQTRDRVLAEQLLRHKQWLGDHYRRLTDQWLTRGTYDSNSIHLDLLSNLKRINNSLSHVAYPELGSTRSATAGANP
ncbi:MAG: Na/Pi cotransporter family protein [Phycisphaerales bacterium]|nr:Na/Pi cotransporter family protein [Phycisphaerales bacterium]